MRRLEQHLASQEQDARQGATTAVQVMHGDRCTAQNIQDGPKTSISFGAKTEPPDLPCREDVLIEDGAATPKSCLPSVEMRTTTAAGGLVPTDKASTATETIFNDPLLRFYATEETNTKKKKYGLQCHPPGTTAASGNCSLPPHA